MVYYKKDIENKKVFVTYYYSNNLDSVYYIDTFYFTKSTENGRKNIFYHKNIHHNNKYYSTIININDTIYFGADILQFAKKKSYNNHDVFIYFYDAVGHSDEEGIIVLNNNNELLLYEGIIVESRTRFDYNNYPKYVTDSVVNLMKQFRIDFSKKFDNK
jgi:hypothetical protein